MRNEGLNLERNIILVVGPFASGKTRTIGLIYSYLFGHDIAEYKPITDATFIEAALDADHRYNDGVNHMHEGQTQPIKHEHNPLEERNLQFMVTGSFIPDRMYSEFFSVLSSDLPRNRIFVAEWSGGANTNPPEHPSSHTDYSFESQVGRLRSGLYRSEWISRVLAVIHPLVPDGGARLELNERRKDEHPTQCEIENGMASWYIPEPGMLITGRNDFPDVIPTLENMGLSGRIFVIPNSGRDEYKTDLRRALDEAIGPLLRSIEGSRLGAEGTLRSKEK